MTKNKRRSGKFYRKNEDEVMRQLGLSPTKNSGSGWIEKEDGQSEHIICQLKSTDAQQITIKLADLKTLVYNSLVSHKIPVFAVQFLSTEDLWLMVRPEDLEAVSIAIKGKSPPKRESSILDDFTVSPDYDEQKEKSVKSDPEARERFRAEVDEERRRKWGTKWN